MSENDFALARSAPLADYALSIEQVMDQQRLVFEMLGKAMRENHHYGVIPGTGTKPTLLKPGAEMICARLRLGPSFTIEREIDGPHLTVFAKCTLTHLPTGNVVCSADGMCSSRESKYAWRKVSRTCPQCGEPAIIKGKAEYGGGWICFTKKGGCGAKFKDNDPSILGQQEGRVENPDVADTHNTVLKMAQKRALVAAVLNGTAASEIFTQDIEDFADLGDAAPVKPPEPPIAPPKAKPKAAVESPKVVTNLAPPTPKATAKISAEQRKRLFAIANDGCGEAALRAHLTTLGIESTSDITTAQYDAICEFARTPVVSDEPPPAGDDAQAEPRWMATVRLASESQGVSTKIAKTKLDAVARKLYKCDSIEKMTAAQLGGMDKAIEAGDIWVNDDMPRD